MNCSAAECVCIKASKCQGIKVSRHQSIKASKCQGIKGSRHQGIKASKYQGIKVSRHQGIKAPRYKGIKVSRHQDIKVSMYEDIIKFWQCCATVMLINSMSVDCDVNKKNLYNESPLPQKCTFLSSLVFADVGRCLLTFLKPEILMNSWLRK